MNDDLQPLRNNANDDKYSVDQASRIYLLPNLMTAGNLFCGFLSVIWCIRAYHEMKLTGIDLLTQEAVSLFRQAVWFIFLAMLFDALDGRLARLGRRESLFGAEFDSIADIVSFGMAPALMVFFLILSPTQGLPFFRQVGWLLGFIYLLCAAIRLARFNVITHPLLKRSKELDNKDFLGLPVPAAAGCIASIVLFLLTFADHDREVQKWILIPLPFLLFLIAILMVSTVRYPSGKKITFKTKMGISTFLIFGATLASIFVFQEYGILAICLGYIFFGLIRQYRHWVKNKKAL